MGRMTSQKNEKENVTFIFKKPPSPDHQMLYLMLNRNSYTLKCHISNLDHQMLYLKLNRNSYTLFPYLKYLTFSNESPIFFRSSGEKKNTPPTQPQTGESRRPSTRRPQVQVQGFWRWFQRWSGGERAHRCEFHRRILTLTMDVYVF